MRRKRTEDQMTFDLAKHGWSFCNKAMLEGKLLRLRELASKLRPNDPRHSVLAQIERTFEQMD